MLLIQLFWADESGFIVSAELVLISTITVLGMVVGLSEVAIAVTGELNDVGAAIGALNQSYSFAGFTITSGSTTGSTLKSSFSGSIFIDFSDVCDNNQLIDILADPVPGTPG
jgi:Flp pilus assembly pilin Flp